MSEPNQKKDKISVGRAIEIVRRAIKAVAGKGQPQQSIPSQTLQSLGISTDEQLQAFKHQLKADVAVEGFQFQKMSVDELQRSHTVAEAADLVVNAQPIETPTMF